MRFNNNAKRISRYMNDRPTLSAAWFFLCMVLAIVLGTLTEVTASTRLDPLKNRIGGVTFYIIGAVALICFLRSLRRIRNQ